MKKFLAKMMTLPVEKQREIIAEATRNLERQLSRGASHSTRRTSPSAGAACCASGGVARECLAGLRRRSDGTAHWTGEWNK